MPEDFHSHGDGGIFIPYDKLLQQQSEKLDKILDTLRDIEKAKLDVAVFDSFRASYEQRHETLKEKVRAFEIDLVDRPQLIKEFREAQLELEALSKYKAEREAVQSQMRYVWTGGGLVGLLVIFNLLINAWQIATGGGIP